MIRNRRAALRGGAFINPQPTASYFGAALRVVENEEEMKRGKTKEETCWDGRFVREAAALRCFDRGLSVAYVARISSR